MAKSFCAGCAHWQLLDDGMGLRFRACTLFACYALEDRRKVCGGRCKREKR